MIPFIKLTVAGLSVLTLAYPADQNTRSFSATSAMKSQAALNTVANTKTLVAEDSKATPVISSVDDRTISISSYLPEAKLLAQSGQAVLTGAWISFYTNNEDKDSDSHVTVQVFKNDGDLAAQTDNDFGHFDDHSNNGPYNLEVLNNAPIKSALAGGKVLIRMDPNGHDTWRFNFTLRLRFSDGSSRNVAANNLELTQNRRQQYFGISGRYR